MSDVPLSSQDRLENLRCKIIADIQMLSWEVATAGVGIGIFDSGYWQTEFAAALERCIDQINMRKPTAADRFTRERAVYLRKAENSRREIAVQTNMAEGLWAMGKQSEAWTIGEDMVPYLEIRRSLELHAVAAFDQVWAEFGNLINPFRPDTGPTTEALRKAARRDPIAMLYAQSHISDEQRSAAREIAWVYESITAGSATKVSRLDGGGMPRNSGRRKIGTAETVALVYSWVYTPWTREIKDKGINLNLVLLIVVHGVSVFSTARMHGLSWKRAVRELGRALSLYAARRIRLNDT